MSDPLSERGAACFAGRVVMVTGAGGSIGAALCRRLLKLSVRRIVLLEQSEFGLFEVHRALAHLAEDTEIVPLLGSVTDPRLLWQALTNWGVETIFHTAAYKHVPMMEANPLAGMINNVLGTQTLGEQALKAGVPRVLFCSTDKAVRPVSVMGFSKYLAEQIINDLDRRSDSTRFATLRLGNVWGSSGSVVPLFQEQIARRDPLTITHPLAERYFLTSQDATRFLLESCALAEGGETFVPQMGPPQRILDIALSLAAGLAPDWEPEIHFTGLRPGEKLSEELALAPTMAKTPHPDLMLAQDAPLSATVLKGIIRDIREAQLSHSDQIVRALVARWSSSDLPSALSGGMRQSS